ncbi:thiol:disulfide interchange protein DsbA/DsbL [Natronospirillum operosum]|uniref:Thiol:disulfide interchange protein n=1 Tax=Natronospirillum operosum TaxID=2759953 RepID=A0A4Z0WCU1_9GAMM|nr:thiol:disulfide interchange protein DsbA/DsbL [Natronospirillum operosum]TGG91525.1 thiol:disulfide interchange protein DsbA/DsbL [Natronospirillum operosum]
MKRRIALASAMLAALLTVHTVKADHLEEGVHYRTLSSPVNVSIPRDKDGIIHEFFWYGCIHCYNLEPAVIEFKNDLPDNLAFEEVPATFSEVHELHGRAFYAWQFLNLPEDTHQALYDEIFVNNNDLRSERALADFFAERGVDAEDFRKMMNSFSVQTKIRVAQNLTAGAQVRGTPSVMVNGRYMIESGMPGVSSNEEMLRIARELALEQASD